MSYIFMDYSMLQVDQIHILGMIYSKILLIFKHQLFYYNKICLNKILSSKITHNYFQSFNLINNFCSTDLK